jgi:hypothetical protein
MKKTEVENYTRIPNKGGHLIIYLWFLTLAVIETAEIQHHHPEHIKKVQGDSFNPVPFFDDLT